MDHDTPAFDDLIAAGFRAGMTGPAHINIYDSSGQRVALYRITEAGYFGGWGWVENDGGTGRADFSTWEAFARRLLQRTAAAQ